MPKNNEVNNSFLLQKKNHVLPCSSAWLQCADDLDLGKTTSILMNASNNYSKMGACCCIFLWLLGM